MSEIKIALLEENLKSELTLDQQQKIQNLKAETMNTIINYTTNNIAITERLNAIENEILNINNAPTNIPKVDEPIQKEQIELSSLIQILQTTAENKHKNVENEITHEIKILTDNPSTDRFETEMKNLTTIIKTSMEETKLEIQNTLERASHIANKEIATHATEQITQLYDKLYKRIGKEKRHN